MPLLSNSTYLTGLLNWQERSGCKKALLLSHQPRSAESLHKEPLLESMRGMIKQWARHELVTDGGSVVISVRILTIINLVSTLIPTAFLCYNGILVRIQKGYYGPKHPKTYGYLGLIHLILWSPKPVPWFYLPCILSGLTLKQPLWPLPSSLITGSCWGTCLPIQPARGHFKRGHVVKWTVDFAFRLIQARAGLQLTCQVTLGMLINLSESIFPSVDGEE